MYSSRERGTVKVYVAGKIFCLFANVSLARGILFLLFFFCSLEERKSCELDQVYTLADGGREGGRGREHTTIRSPSLLFAPFRHRAK